MSRPNWSVPRRCTRLGATIIELKSFSSGSNGAIQSAKPPAMANTTTIARPIPPSGLRRQKLSAFSSGVLARHGASASATSVAGVGVMAVMRASRIADAWIEPGVKHVDHEVGEHEYGDHQHDQRLGQHVVLVLDRLHQQPADAVQVEDLFGDDEAADQEGELAADHRHHREKRVLVPMADDYDLLEQAHWASGADL